MTELPTRRPSLSALVVLALIGALALSCSTADQVRAASSTPANAACGGEVPPQKADGSAWACSFDDEFNGTAVDASKWMVDQTSYNGQRVGMSCFVNDPRTVSVGGGVLSLSVIKTPKAFLCAGPTGRYYTRYAAGSVNSFGHFTQRYGRFEIRARFPKSTVAGL